MRTRHCPWSRATGLCVVCPGGCCFKDGFMGSTHPGIALGAVPGIGEALLLFHQECFLRLEGASSVRNRQSQWDAPCGRHVRRGPGQRPCFCFTGSSGQSPLLVVLSGNHTGQAHFTSRGSQLFLRWSTDHATSKKGFKLRYSGERRRRPHGQGFPRA